jgi:hypothetical protein
MIVNVWDRQPGESEGAYRAFVFYRDMGPDRNLIATNAGVRKVRDQGTKRGVSGGCISLWSSKWKWVERCRAWDNHLQAEKDRVAEAEARKWERRRQANREANFDLAMKLRDRVAELLKRPIRRRVGKRKNGEPIVIEPAAWTQRDLAILSKAAADLAAQSMPGDIGPRPDAGIPPGLKVPDRDARYEAEEPG